MIPDDRCVGGRQSVELELYSMRRKILNAKSSIDTRLDSHCVKKIMPKKSPRPSSPLARSINGLPNEMHETFRRVAAVAERKPRHYSNPNAPVNRHSDGSLACRLSYNRASKRAARDHVDAQHHNNIMHMYRRMEDMHSLTERKKNVHDASIYPCYIRRRPCEDAPTSLLRSTNNPPTQFSEYTSRKAYGERNSASEARPATAPAANHPNLRYKAPGSDSAGTYLSSSQQAVYEQYYSALMQAIVSQRLYQEAPLKKLFRQFLLSDAADMQDIAQKVVADLKEELDIR